MSASNDKMEYNYFSPAQPTLIEQFGFWIENSMKTNKKFYKCFMNNKNLDLTCFVKI